MQKLLALANGFCDLYSIFLQKGIQKSRFQMIRNRDFLELMTGLEPVTSPLPRACTTTCATSAFLSAYYLHTIGIESVDII
jgi:hypothetical protein